jgi:hypothetical protein
VKNGDRVSPTGPEKQSHGAVLGILAGVGLGIAAGLTSVFLIVVFYGSHGNKWLFVLLMALPYILPPGVVIYFGMVARRNKRPRFAAGYFIAASLVVLLEAACANSLWRS